MPRRRLTALTAATLAALTLTTAACSGGGGSDGIGGLGNGDSKSTADEGANAAAATPGGPEATQVPSDAKPIATTEAEAGIIGYIYSVVRDGKFVTVTAAVENTTDEPYMPSSWKDRKTQIKPYTLLGSYLIDKQNALRYPVLRDTENNCVCTEPFGPMDPKEKRSIYLTFKAPKTDRVDVQIGKMAARPVTITKAGS